MAVERVKIIDYTEGTIILQKLRCDKYEETKFRINKNDVFLAKLFIYHRKVTVTNVLVLVT